MSEPILSVRDLTTYFYTEEGTTKAVDGVSFDIYPGETFGIVGESGSGKSVTAFSLMQLIDDPGRIESGKVYYKGQNILELDEKEIRKLRGNEISMIFQDPMTSLNPVFTVGAQIKRVIRKHTDISKQAARERTIQLMEDVGIPQAESRVDEYPHQFSGGMRQRVLVAMAISCEPNILIADEPTTALDVTIEAQIFKLLSDLQEEYDMSIILITHDLGVIAETCDRAAVTYAGRTVERGTVDHIYTNPKHPYTRGLMRSIPTIRGNGQELSPIEGNVPDLMNLPSGCSFHPRCPHATEACTEYDPELREVNEEQYSACIRVEGYGPIPDKHLIGEGNEINEMADNKN